MKRIRETVERSSGQAHALLLFAMRCSVLSLYAAFVILTTPLTARSLRIIRELYSLPRGLLLLAAVLCPILEERSRLR